MASTRSWMPDKLATFNLAGSRRATFLKAVPSTRRAARGANNSKESLGHIAARNFNFWVYSCTFVIPGVNFGMLAHGNWGFTPTPAAAEASGSVVDGGIVGKLTDWKSISAASQKLRKTSHVTPRFSKMIVPGSKLLQLKWKTRLWKDQLEPRAPLPMWKVPDLTTTGSYQESRYLKMITVPNCRSQLSCFPWRHAQDPKDVQRLEATTTPATRSREETHRISHEDMRKSHQGSWWTFHTMYLYIYVYVYIFSHMFQKSSFLRFTRARWKKNSPRSLKTCLFLREAAGLSFFFYQMHRDTKLHELIGERENGWQRCLKLGHNSRCVFEGEHFSKLCALFSVRFRIRGKHIFNQQKLQVCGRFVSGDAVIMKEPAPEGGELVRSLTRPGRVFVVRRKSTQQPRVEMPWISTNQQIEILWFWFHWAWSVKLPACTHHPKAAMASDVGSYPLW